MSSVKAKSTSSKVKAAPPAAKAKAKVKVKASVKLRVASAPLGQIERGVRDLELRYPTLHVAADFKRALSNWLVTVPSALRLPLWNSLRIAVSDKRQTSDSDAPAAAAAADAGAGAGTDATVARDVASDGKA